MKSIVYPRRPRDDLFISWITGHTVSSGEITKVHHADVRLICATTEDPESSLLKTFVRRIPITIQMPQFEARSVREQLVLLKRLLTLEANRTQKYHSDRRCCESFVRERHIW